MYPPKNSIRDRANFSKRNKISKRNVMKIVFKECSNVVLIDKLLTVGFMSLLQSFNSFFVLNSKLTL